jgi:hypothetical protein
MQMRSRDLIKNWKAVVNTMLFLSNKALFVYKLSNSDVCDPIP